MQRSHLNAAKRVIATEVLEYYFDGRFTTDELLISYETIQGRQVLTLDRRD